MTTKKLLELRKVSKVCKLPRTTKKRLKNMEPGVKNGNYDSSEMRIYAVRRNKKVGGLRVSHMSLG